MSDTKKISEVDAIQEILSESGTMDYIDIVNAVYKRFRLNVTAADVERVVNDLVSTKSTVKPRAQVSLDLSANVPAKDETTPASSTPGSPSGSISTRPVSQPADQSKSELDNALHFVKSVGGLAKAKLLLAELEAIFVGRD